MSKEYRVNVYADQHLSSRVLSRVRYNADLDHWDGRNFSNGGPGRHAGITRMRNGDYVKIVGSDWQGDKDYAYIISPSEALDLILKSGNLHLLDLKKFFDLKDLYLQMEHQEYDDDEM